MANLHIGQSGISRREYDIRTLKALGYNADGAIVFQFPNGDLTVADGEITFSKYSDQLAVMLNEHPTAREVKVRKYYILTEYPDRLEYEETFYENEATHYAELMYSVADGEEVERFYKIIREHSGLTSITKLHIMAAFLYNFSSCPNDGEMPYIEGFNEDNEHNPKYWEDGVDALGGKNVDRLLDAVRAAL